MASNPPLPPEPPSPSGLNPAYTPPPPPPPIEPGGVIPPPAGGPPLLPWEQPGYPFLEGLYETAKLFFTEPTAAFERMQLGGELGRPILYAIIFGWLGTIAGQVYNIVMGGAMYKLLPHMPEGPDFGSNPLFNVGVMVVAPLLVLIALFVGAAIYHLFLLLYGGASSGFGATVRVLCYASTVQILQVLPICGGLVGAVWGIVLQVIGLAVAHRTTRVKAAGAILTPILLCCLCAVLILVLAFGGALAAARGAMR
ncbi:MAG TPA: YIP1 family protein [Thermoanaerobaculaceae bacterium]|nr:YIP1 family protein [Thermoanaerobaculaceae bacterium]HRS15670.1 YIP1 family protein [Thermoanaerobaculaceae bacterium]